VYSSDDIARGVLDEKLVSLYGPDRLELQRRRYQDLIEAFSRRFPLGEGGSKSERGATLVSSPGRTELAGNHTDHNNGRVLAASIHLDQIAASAKTEENRIRLVSEGFDREIALEIDDLSYLPEEEGSPEAIIRGIARWFEEHGYTVGGFDAYLKSDVAMGSGLSSSACFEVLIGKLFSVFYNDDRLSPVELSIAGRWGENNYFGKPCGLMDQLACSVGGIIAIDFADPANPSIENKHYSFREHGLRLCIVDTGGSHADLTPDYAAAPEEMGCIASVWNEPVLRGVAFEEILSRIPSLRSSCGDRAILRSFHFYKDNERVQSMVKALEAGDIEKYLTLVRESASSSWRFLQNCIPTGETKEQGVALAIALCEHFLEGRGAVRVHGGGFAGTIQVYVPDENFAAFEEMICSVFGEDAVTEIVIRDEGVITL
jgi:galactokinase